MTSDVGCRVKKRLGGYEGLAREGELAGLGLMAQPPCRLQSGVMLNHSRLTHAIPPPRRYRPSVFKHSLRTLYAVSRFVQLPHLTYIYTIHLRIAVRRDFFLSSLKRVMRSVLNSTSGLRSTAVSCVGKGQSPRYEQKYPTRPSPLEI